MKFMAEPGLQGIRMGKGTQSGKKMSEVSSIDNQSGASPARQMLAALTQASREMTAKFNEISEKACKLNVALENDVNKSLAEIDQLAELIVRVQLEGLAAEKESVLAELTILRQQELQVLQNISRSLRDALAEKLQELVDGLRNDVKEQLTLFQKDIGQKEAEVVQAERSIRKALREGLPAQIESIQRKMNTEKKDLESLHFRQQGLLAQEAKLSLEKLREHGTLLKGRLAKVQSGYLESMELTVRDMVQTLSESLDRRIQELASIQEKARPQIQVDMAFLEKLPASFSESCRQIRDLRVKMHDSTVRNLSMLYGAEIESICRETEDKLVVVRSHLQSLLRGYQDNFAEQSSMLLWKFEKDAREARPAPSEMQRSVGEEQVPVELFDKLRTEIRIVARTIVPAAEKEMEHGFADYRARLNASSQNACAMIESSFHECRKRINELAESHREELEELSQKGNALEQLVDAARDLIGAMNPSNLDF
jgi:hypothetical protein